MLCSQFIVLMVLVEPLQYTRPRRHRSKESQIPVLIDLTPQEVSSCLVPTKSGIPDASTPNMLLFFMEIQNQTQLEEAKGTQESLGPTPCQEQDCVL